MSKSAAKNAKRKAKKNADKEKAILDNWDDSDGDEDKDSPSAKQGKTTEQKSGKTAPDDLSPSDSASLPKLDANDGVNDLADDIQKLKVDS